MLQTLATAVLAFISTNIDDLFILMMLCAQRTASLQKHHIFGGQMLGIITLIILSLAGMFFGLLVPKEFIGLLGLFPIYLGVKNMIEHFKNHDEDAPEDLQIATTNNTAFFSRLIAPASLQIAIITIANGGDNIGVYIPLFSSMHGSELLLMIATFIALILIWIKFAEYLVDRPTIVNYLKRSSGVVFPLVLIALGVFIIIESGIPSLIFRK